MKTGNSAGGRGALGVRDAARYIGVSRRWLENSDCPLPKVDIRRPGAMLPVWRWRVADIDAFLEQRLVEPGHRSPWGDR